MLRLSLKFPLKDAKLSNAFTHSILNVKVASSDLRTALKLPNNVMRLQRKMILKMGFKVATLDLEQP